MDLTKLTDIELHELKDLIDIELKNRAGKPETVIVTIEKDKASGRRESWLKLISGVDDTQKGGYAFEGDFLDSGEHELPVGGIIVECAPRGSVKNWRKEGIIYKVLETGKLETMAANYDWYKEAVSFRYKVAELI